MLARIPRNIPGLILTIALALPAHAAVGDIDLSFGEGGILKLAPDYNGFAALPDGRLQSISVVDGVLRVLRMDANGRPDATFGAAGVVTSPLSVDASYWPRQTVLGNGSTYLALGTNTSESEGLIAKLMRLDLAGRPDASFGTNGLRVFPAEKVAGARISLMEGFVIAPSGAVYVMISYYRGWYESSIGLSVFRLTPSGEPDLAFGEAGEYRVNATCEEIGWGCGLSLVALADDKLLLNSPTNPQVLDAQGKAVPAPSRWTAWQQAWGEIAISPAGEYIYTISFLVDQTDKSSRIVVARWRKDLTLDLTFGGDGVGYATFVSNTIVPLVKGFDGANLFAPRPGGFLYLALSKYDEQLPPGSAGRMESEQYIARLHDDGRLDTSFGNAGAVLATGDQIAAPIDQQADGSLVLQLGWTAIRLRNIPDASPGLIHASDMAGRYAIGVSENAGTLEIPVRRMFGSQGAVSISYSTRALDATAGSDYTDVSGTLSWVDGESGAKSIGIPILNDAIVESDERFEVVFEVQSGGAGLNVERGRYSISSDDNQVPATVPPPTSVTPEPEVTKGGGGAFGISLPGLLAALLLVRSRRRGACSSHPDLRD